MVPLIFTTTAKKSWIPTKRACSLSFQALRHREATPRPSAQSLRSRAQEALGLGGGPGGPFQREAQEGVPLVPPQHLPQLLRV